MPDSQGGSSTNPQRGSSPTPSPSPQGGERRGQKRQKAIEIHTNFFTAYKKVLQGIKILDPACGSGAFLTRVFDYLLAENELVFRELDKLANNLYDELLPEISQKESKDKQDKQGKNSKQKAQAKQDMFEAAETQQNKYQKQVSMLGREILLNNLYGVDLNYESTEITKLSLWLKTANKYGVTLANLSDNIKIGNSLVADKNIDQKAFEWQGFGGKAENKATNTGLEAENLEVFDVIVGNPPYGGFMSKEQINYIQQHYQTAEYQVNTYVVFFEKALQLLKKNGMLGFITPNTFTYQNYFKKIRNYFANYSIEYVKKHQYQVFPDANTGDTVSWIMKKSEQKDYIKLKVSYQLADEEKKDSIWVAYKDFINPDGTYHLENIAKIAMDLSNCEPLGDLAEIIMGVKAYQEGKGKPKQTREIVNEKPFTATYAKDETFLRCVNGKDFHKYQFLQSPKMFLSYGEWLAEPRFNASFFEAEKIIVRQTADSLICHLDTTKFINLNNVYNIAHANEKVLLKYVLAILNSSIMNYVYQNIAQEKGKLFAEVKKVYLEKLPIKIIPLEEQQKIVSKVDNILSIQQSLNRYENLQGTENFSIFEDLKAALDSEICKLYGVSEEFLRA